MTDMGFGQTIDDIKTIALHWLLTVQEGLI